MSVPAADKAEARAAELGQRLRAARAKAGMTRRQLAAASGTSERYLANLEAGGNPSVEVLAALAGALDVAMAELLPRGGERSGLHADAASLLRLMSEERLQALLGALRDTRGGGSAKARRIALVGLRGAGKSTLGQALAERLEFPFFEISKEVERLYGGSLGDLIELGGQVALRRYERAAWDAISARHAAAVIGVPGGIVADGPLYDLILGSAHSVWLQASPEDHMGRVVAQGDLRPMAQNRGAMIDLKAILAARGADYARADLHLDTSRQDFSATLDLLERDVRRMMAPLDAI